MPTAEPKAETPGYAEEMIGSPAPSADAATAEATLAKSRGETYGGLLRESADQLKIERQRNSTLYARIELEQANTMRAMAELRTWLDEDLRRRREDASAAMKVVNLALEQSHQNVERAKLTATVLNTPPPPKTTAGENVTELGKTLINAMAGILTTVFAGDRVAQDRIKAMGGKLLDLVDGGPAEATDTKAITTPAAAASAGAAPPADTAPATSAPAPATADKTAASAAPAPAPAPPAARKMTVGEAVSLALRLSKADTAKLSKYCEARGVSPDELSVEEVLAFLPPEPTDAG